MASEKKKFPSTSVVIITRNRADLLKKCLGSLLNQSVSPNEVIIVDNASIDLTKKVALSFGKKLNAKYLFQPIVSISISRNTGFKIATSEIILSLDDDCIAPRNWIRNSINSHLENPSAVAIQGNIISIPDDKIYSIILQKHRDFRIDKSRLNSGELLYLNTSNCSFKSDFLQKHKLKFHETLRYMGDEIDLAAQIITEGGLISFEKKNFVYHKERDNLIDFLHQRYRQGIIPHVIKKRWPNLRFHFYNSTPLAHFSTFLEICKQLIKLNKYLDLICLPFILTLTILVFELAIIDVKFKHNK